MVPKLPGYCFQEAATRRIRLRPDRARPCWASCNSFFVRARWGAFGLFLFLCLSGLPQTAEVPVPTIDGDLGPCSVEFTVTDQKFQPLYNAQVHVRFKYGFLGLRKMNLRVGTNSAGKARVKGLPAKLRDLPLDFVITYSGVSQHWFWTGLECSSQTQVVLKVH
jgi:hypothetical protein